MSQNGKETEESDMYLQYYCIKTYSAIMSQNGKKQRNLTCTYNIVINDWSHLAAVFLKFWKVLG